MKRYPIIDIFAGPGGLGEGFSRFKNEITQFEIALSIEKEVFAHKTLELRVFYRSFNADEVPEDYYDYLYGKISRRELFSRWPSEAKKAKEETWCHELKDGDIAEVTKRARKALKSYSGIDPVLIGGPPCQAYSVVGRARMKNHTKNFEDDARHYLYRHYLRLVAHLKPSIFIMENVKGFLTASSKGEWIFQKVLNDLERPGQAVKELDKLKKSPTSKEYDIYSLVLPQEVVSDDSGTHVKKLRPKDYIIHSEKYGVPQRRHRVILMGIRKDLDPENSVRLFEHPALSAASVLKDLPKLRSGITGGDSHERWHESMVRICEQKWFGEIDKETKDVLISHLSRLNKDLGRGANRVEKSVCKISGFVKDWYVDEKMQIVCNHESKSHMESDLWRYFFSSCFAKAHGRSPLLTDYPKGLLPDHKNVTPTNTKFLDRFKVQQAGSPASTVTSHISKDGHFYIHHDPLQCRAWTVREAARIQTFPDNYFFEGNKTEQYLQVGNAVPPYLAFQIATVVAKQLESM